MVLEQALEREAADLLSKLKKMIKNKHKAEQDKASINQRVAEVSRSRTHTHPGTQEPALAYTNLRTHAYTHIDPSYQETRRWGGRIFCRVCRSPAHRAELASWPLVTFLLQVDRRLSKMKLHGSVVPHKKDIDELRYALLSVHACFL